MLSSGNSSAEYVEIAFAAGKMANRASVDSRLWETLAS